MKKILAKFLVLTVMLMVLASSCAVFVDNSNKDDNGNGTDVPEKYKDFYNYPDGRKNPAGTLQIRNSINSPVLLFTSDVSGANYIGTVGSLDSIKVTLPEQKFYTIVAVDKKTWEEKGDQAERYSDLTYFSRTQPYSMAVSPSSLGGGGKWIINNNTNYWVSFKEANQSGEIFAVAAPNAKRVLIPVQIGATYDFVPHFYRELKYQGNVIALAESDVISEADTVIIRSTTPNLTFTTDIGEQKIPSSKIKPTVFFTNNSGKTVRVYNGGVQLSNGAEAADDFALMNGDYSLFSGLVENANVNNINFRSIAWTSPKYVTQSLLMENNKVYKITIGNEASNFATTVTEEDAETFYAN
ncbi:hypothetical protein R84B8_01933 [Treponema sp. R8-4-B8]